MKTAMIVSKNGAILDLHMKFLESSFFGMLKIIKICIDKNLYASKS